MYKSLEKSKYNFIPEKNGNIWYHIFEFIVPSDWKFEDKMKHYLNMLESISRQILKYPYTEFIKDNKNVKISIIVEYNYDKNSE